METGIKSNNKLSIRDERKGNVPPQEAEGKVTEVTEDPKRKEAKVSIPDDDVVSELKANQTLVPQHDQQHGPPEMQSEATTLTKAVASLDISVSRDNQIANSSGSSGKPSTVSFSLW